MRGSESSLQVFGRVMREFVIPTLILTTSTSAWTAAFTGYGPAPEDVVQWGPTGLTPLLRSPDRVGSIIGFGGGTYFYRCEPEGINKLLDAYAKADMEYREVFLWPSMESFRSTAGTALDHPPVNYNVVLRDPSDALRRFHDNELFYPRKPRLIIYVNDVKMLDKLNFPPGLDLVHPAQLLDIANASLENVRMNGSAKQYFRDLGPDAYRAGRPNQLSILNTSVNEYLIRLREEALESFAPNENFRRISDRIFQIVREHTQ